MKCALLYMLVTATFTNAYGEAIQASHGDHRHEVKDVRKMIRGVKDIDGYLDAGWWQMQSDVIKAEELVLEGLQHNPDSFQLHYLRGQIQLNQARKTAGRGLSNLNPEASALLVKSGLNYQKGAELGFGYKKQVGKDSWTPYLDDDLRGTARMAVLVEKRFGNPEKAMQLIKSYTEKLGGDHVLERNVIKEVESSAVPVKK